MVFRRQKAFTLVELLVVMVVLAVLASITIIVYSGAQNRADDAALRVDADQFNKLVELKKTDTRKYICQTCSTSAEIAAAYNANDLIPRRANTYLYSVISANPPEFDKKKLVIIIEDTYQSLISVAYWSIADDEWKITVYFSNGGVSNITDTTPIPTFDI